MLVTTSKMISAFLLTASSRFYSFSFLGFDSIRSSLWSVFVFILTCGSWWYLSSYCKSVSVHRLLLLLFVRSHQLEDVTLSDSAHGDSIFKSSIKLTTSHSVVTMRRKVSGDAATETDPCPANRDTPHHFERSPQLFSVYPPYKRTQCTGQGSAISIQTMSKVIFYILALSVFLLAQLVVANPVGQARESAAIMGNQGRQPTEEEWKKILKESEEFWKKPDSLTHWYHLW
jgi:hypothetical protein